MEGIEGVLGSDATGPDQDRNEENRVADRRRRRPGKRGNVEQFILTQRNPQWFAALRGKKRQEVTAANAALLARFDRPLLALIVLLEDRIREAYGTRQDFITALEEKKEEDKSVPQVDKFMLSRQLGGNASGPEWWLAELISKHCAGDRNAVTLKEQCARLWRAAHGRKPKGWDGSLEPATSQEIAELIDPPAPSGPVEPTAGSPPLNSSDLAALFEGLPDALLLVDANGTVVNANNIAQETFDATGISLVGRGLLELLPDFDINRLPRLVNSSDHQAEGRQPPLRMTARRTDGSELQTEVHSANLADGRSFYDPTYDEVLTGRGSSYVGDGLLMVVVRDLTSTQDTKAELVRQQRQTEMILRTVSEGIIRVDTSGRIVLANPAAAAALGYRAIELGGQPLHPLMHHTRADGSALPYEETPIADTLRSGRPRRLRGQVLWTKDKRPVRVDLSTAPVHEGDQIVGAVMTFAVRQPLTMLEGLGPRHALLLALMDETLSGTLEYSQAKLEGLAAEAAGQPGPVSHVLHELTAEHARMTMLVRNVMDYQRLDTRQEDINRRTVALDGVVAAGVNEAKVLIGPHDLRFSVSVPQIDVEVDPARLARALAHTLADMAAADTKGNSPAGSHSTITITATQQDDSGESNDGTVVRIELRGPYRGGSRSPLHQPMVRNLVQLHGGTLQTRDVPGDGSACIIELPSGGTEEMPALPPKPLWQHRAAQTARFAAPLAGSYTLIEGDPQTPGQAFAALTNTPVKAVHSAVITRVTWSSSGYQLVLRLEDCLPLDEDTEITYDHLSSITQTAGKVSTGDIIGRVGAPRPIGHAHASHNGTLNLTVKPNGDAPTDPVTWLREHGVDLHPSYVPDTAEAVPTADQPKTEPMWTTRIRLNIPGSRPIPPIVMRTPVGARTVKMDAEQHPEQH
ncbi:PAS domain-containing protein [Streptomyces sp. 7N604]|uniref:PAS domain-containing protein n=1 Tax=Streptomyces sp. 7N604 TaxID=3457415 RepID=UPI003FCF144B